MMLHSNTKSTFIVAICIAYLYKGTWATVEVEAKQAKEEESLRNMAKAGNKLAVTKLLKRGVDVDAIDSYGWSALHCAADAGNDEVVKVLLAAGTEVDLRDFNGLTPLHLATKKSFVKVILALVSAGANVGSQDKSWLWTPLHWAVYQNAADLVVALLTKEVDINFKDYKGQTPLHLASKGGHIDVVQKLLSAKPDIGIRDLNGKTALDVAANQHVSKEILKHELHEGMVLPAVQKLRKDLLSLEECNTTLQQTVENLAVAQQSEQDCLNGFESCSSRVQQLKQNLDQEGEKCHNLMQNASVTFQQNITILTTQLQYCSEEHITLKQNVSLLKKELEDATTGFVIMSTMCTAALVLLTFSCCCKGNGEYTAQVAKKRAEERATIAMAEEEAKAAKERATAADARAVEAEERAAAVENEMRVVKVECIAAEERANMAEKEAREAKEREIAAEESATVVVPSWTVQRVEIDLTDQVLGTGGWCVVKLARFRGLDVAAKLLHHTILSPYNLHLFKREMNIAAMTRHPNLLLFIGATVDKECIILTELMPYNLREVLENGKLSNQQVFSVATDVCLALNYLHSIKPFPIVHRDVSSANILLEALGEERWRAKLSDYGSANFVRQISTAAPGSSAYAAPESLNPSQQSPKMDTFSVGVLLLEMISGQFPDMQRKEFLIRNLTSPTVAALIKECTSKDPNSRPDMALILLKLKNCS